MHDQQMLWEETLLGEEKEIVKQEKEEEKEEKKEEREGRRNEQGGDAVEEGILDMLSHKRPCIAKARTKLRIGTNTIQYR